MEGRRERGWGSARGRKGGGGDSRSWRQAERDERRDPAMGGVVQLTTAMRYAQLYLIIVIIHVFYAYFLFYVLYHIEHDIFLF